MQGSASRVWFLFWNPIPEDAPAHACPGRLFCLCTGLRVS